MTVWMLCVRRLPGDRHADQRYHVRCRVGQRVEAVGEDRDRAGVIPQRDLRERDEKVEKENAVEDAGDFGIAVCHTA